MTTAKWKRTLAALGAVAFIAGLAAAYVLIMSRSQTVLDARHPLPPSAVRAAVTPEEIAQGHALVVVTACIACHGKDLTGRAEGLGLYAPNLTRAVPKLSDAELDRAIRHGLRPDGTSELGMPSYAFAAFTDQEVGAIIGYLRSLPPKGSAPVHSGPGLLLRANLLAGTFKTETDKLGDARPPLDTGPQTAAGRHLTAIACSQCHGPDLGGGKGFAGPDLDLQDAYNRAQFHILLKTGVAADNEDTELMSRTAVASLSHLSDPQIDAVFDYLQARDRILGAQAKGSAGH